MGVLATADPADEARMYSQLGLALTYHPDGRAGSTGLPPRS
jgi:hypothetical protein